MKKTALATCLILQACFANAQQSDNRLRARYSLPHKLGACNLELRISVKQAGVASLRLNNKLYRGRMTRNWENPGEVYNFYPSIDGRKQLVLLEFRDDDSCATVTIANQDYLSVFRPCLDAKYITLRACY